MRIRERLMQQFGMPEGTLGRIAGFIMAHRSSNIERIEWAIAKLDARAADCVIEIGFGPGIGIKMLSDRVVEGKVYGIDHSPLMAKKATSRNKVAVDSGRVELIVASCSHLPSFDRRIDKVLDINTFQFWEEPMRVMLRLRAALMPGGTIAIVHEPRQRGATDQDTIDAGRRISETLEASGFEDVHQELRRMKPVSTICVIGKNPA